MKTVKKKREHLLKMLGTALSKRVQKTIAMSVFERLNRALVDFTSLCGSG